jgi:hypothetical protein
MMFHFSEGGGRINRPSLKPLQRHDFVVTRDGT